MWPINNIQTDSQESGGLTVTVGDVTGQSILRGPPSENESAMTVIAGRVACQVVPRGIQKVKAMNDIAVSLVVSKGVIWGAKELEPSTAVVVGRIACQGVPRGIKKVAMADILIAGVVVEKIVV